MTWLGLLESKHSDLGLAWAFKVKTWDLIVTCTCVTPTSDISEHELLPPKATNQRRETQISDAIRNKVWSCFIDNECETNFVVIFKYPSKLYSIVTFHIWKRKCTCILGLGDVYRIGIWRCPQWNIVMDDDIGWDKLLHFAVIYGCAKFLSSLLSAVRADQSMHMWVCVFWAEQRRDSEPREVLELTTTTLVTLL